LTREPDELIDVITRRVMEELSRRDAPTARAPAIPDARAAEPSRPTGAGEALDLATAERLRLFSVSGVRGPDETRALHQAGAARVVATMGYCPASTASPRSSTTRSSSPTSAGHRPTVPRLNSAARCVNHGAAVPRALVAPVKVCR
jgi:hypothetical protein